MATTVRILAVLGVAYLAVLAILFALQSSLIYPAPQDVPPLTPGYSEVRLETDDGLSLRAFHQRADHGKPTVLYFHGNGGTLAGASVSNGAVAQAGLGVLLVEYRGYGGNPGEPSEDGFYLDAEAALRWLSDEGIAPSQTVVTGNSIGGGVATFAVQALVDRGTPPAALILIAPFTSLPDVASQTFWWLPVRVFLNETFPNRERLGGLAQVPVLIQHGTIDNVIEDSHGKALARIPQVAEFQSFDGSGHALSFEQRSQEARRDWILALRVSDTR
ncbi:alpha/beta hydrolase [uncultured Erythrobacter sp.]|uniref:alpha/beta hydrolase n=1 Tax=uncultured Erythrobacter sp. TaxID=263913 RepID=UPI00260C905C|nr:alpha/beta hydrolase [uncultured Erythrobacter sp.]